MSSRRQIIHARYVPQNVNKVETLLMSVRVPDTPNLQHWLHNWFNKTRPFATLKSIRVLPRVPDVMPGEYNAAALARKVNKLERERLQ